MVVVVVVIYGNLIFSFFLAIGGNNMMVGSWKTFLLGR